MDGTSIKFFLVMSLYLAVAWHYLGRSIMQKLWKRLPDDKYMTNAIRQAEEKIQEIRKKDLLQ